MQVSRSFSLLFALSCTLAARAADVVNVDAVALRHAASVYVAPVYPPASIREAHSGRVVVKVIVGVSSPTSALARVLTATVVEAPDPGLGESVVKSLDEARYMPFFDDSGNVVKASSIVVWEFRLGHDAASVVDPNAPPAAAAATPHDLALQDLKIVHRANELLASESMWNRHDNRQCPPNAKTVSLYCAFERATIDVTGTFEHRGSVMEDARAAMDEVAPHHPDYGHYLLGYNNDPSTSFADIQRVLAVTAARVKKRVAE